MSRKSETNIIPILKCSVKIKEQNEESSNKEPAKTDSSQSLMIQSAWKNSILEESGKEEQRRADKKAHLGTSAKPTKPVIDDKSEKVYEGKKQVGASIGKSTFYIQACEPTIAKHTNTQKHSKSGTKQAKELQREHKELTGLDSCQGHVSQELRSTQDCAIVEHGFAHQTKQSNLWAIHLHWLVFLFPWLLALSC